MSEQPYQIGQIVNGHRWTGVVWEPVTLPPPTGSPFTAPPPPPSGQPFWKKWWVWVIVAVVLLALIGAIGASGGSKTASTSSSAAATVVRSPQISSLVPTEQPTVEPTTQAPTPEPTTEAPTPTPTEKPASDWAPIVVKGSGSKVVKLDKPSDRAAIVTLTHEGDSNFVVWALDSTLKETQLLVNTIGNYRGTTLLDPDTADVTARLKIEADGNWTLKVQDVTKARRVTEKIVGTGDDVVIYSGPAGVIAARALSEDNFVVWSYSDSSDLLFNEIGPYRGENTISGGPLVLSIQAVGSWSMNVTP